MTVDPVPIPLTLAVPSALAVTAAIPVFRELHANVLGATSTTFPVASLAVAVADAEPPRGTSAGSATMTDATVLFIVIDAFVVWPSVTMIATAADAWAVPLGLPP
jgi:hypothetical protein